MNSEIFFKFLFSAWAITVVGMLLWLIRDCWRFRKFSKSLDKEMRR